jgi:integrase
VPNWLVDACVDLMSVVDEIERIYSPHQAEPSRDRVLTDPELRSVWNAAKQMAYPFGTIIQLLILTGQRKSEIGRSTLGMDLRQRRPLSVARWRSLRRSA